MKIILTESQLKNLLLEYEVAPFNYLGSDKRDEYMSEESHKYSFESGGIKYYVYFHQKSGSRAFEVSFDYEGGYKFLGRTHKDLKHFNNVLYTVLEIVKDAVAKFKMKMIEFEGSRGVNDRLHDESLKSKVYRRLLYNIYPHDSIIERNNRTYVDMTIIYPELFNKMDKSAPDLFFDLIEKGTNSSLSKLDRKSAILYYINDKDFHIRITDNYELKLKNENIIEELDIYLDENDDSLLIIKQYNADEDVEGEEIYEHFKTPSELYTRLYHFFN